MNKFKEVLERGAEIKKINLNKEIKNKFEQYYNMLIEENEKYNLTAITDPSEAAEKHFLDSLLLTGEIESEKGNKIIDIGSGAGFPGLSLKIYKNDLKLTLIEAVAKKVNFMKAVIEKLKLNNAVAIHGRAEDMAEKYRDTYDVAVSRAVAEMRVLLEYTLPFIKIGGILVAAKGPGIVDELKEARNALKLLGGEIESIREEKLPISQDGRTIIVVRKTGATPNKYPRRAGTPKKKPL